MTGTVRVPPSEQEVESFVQATFRSVWSLELLLLLRSDQERVWPRPDLVRALRASEMIVAEGLESLVAAGLVSIDAEGARYRPAAADLDALSSATEALYAKSPVAVRRMIVMGVSDNLSAFANAFRLRKD